MNNTHGSGPRDRFPFESLSPDFLRKLTEINAAEVFEHTKNPDHRQNWEEGKRLTGFTIVDRYIEECLRKNECTPLPECCCDYLREIEFEDVKRYKAYFIWEEKGRIQDNPKRVMDEEYFEGCEYILTFCDLLNDKKVDLSDCNYSYMLQTIDRRHGEDRRKLADRRQANVIKLRRKERRTRKERRLIPDRRKVAA